MAASKNVVLRALNAVPAKAWVVVGAAVLLGASALFGGLDDADRRNVEPPVIATGDEFVGTQYTTVVHDAVLLDTLPGSTIAPDDEGNVFLMVSATVTNDWRMTWSLGDLLTIDSLPADAREPQTTVHLDDDSRNVRPQPGVASDVGFIWEVPASMFADGDGVRVTITNRTLVTVTYLTYGDDWRDPVAAAWVDVPIDDQTGLVVPQ